MDAFFAAIEQRDHPEIAGKPVVVGGDPKGRGVVSTCSYEARQYGIRSAMPAAHAYRLCPQAVFVRPRFEAYEQASGQILAVMRLHTDRVESVSLDEAYLDVTRHRFGIEDPVVIARMLKQNIFARTRLRASAGVAPNLFLAKIASDFEKPDGLTVIRPDAVTDFLRDLPVRKIPGVGPVTEKELAGMGILTCGELAGVSRERLVRRFGKTGNFLHDRALGIDESEVEPWTEPKQLSGEETFERDTRDVAWLEEKLTQQAREIWARLKAEKRMGKTVVLKVKYFDFQQITRSRTLPRPPADWSEVYETACRLLVEKTLAGQKPIRLLGLGISGLKPMQEWVSAQIPDLFSLVSSEGTGV